MKNHKTPFMDAIVKSLVILLSMKQKTLNQFTKQEIEVEIKNLVRILVEQKEFESFLLDILKKDMPVKYPKPKTGPLGNSVPEKKDSA